MFWLFLSGAVFALLAATVFPPEHRPPIWRPIVVSATGFTTAAAVYILGKKLRPKAAAWFGGAYIATLLLIAATSSALPRATIAGVLIVVVLVLFAWFMPIAFTRWFGYSTLAVYIAIFITRYPTNDGALMALALVALTILLTEVFGRFQRSLEQSSLTDHLCKVWNRRGFEVMLEKEISTVIRTREPLSLIFLDLDDFKNINDKQGHTAGDDVLQQIASQLEESVRSGDAVARLGGDEFVLLLPRTSALEAEQLADRLADRVTACSWSYGVAEYAQGQTANDFIASSDEQMFKQKRSRGQRQNQQTSTETSGS